MAEYTINDWDYTYQQDHMPSFRIEILRRIINKQQIEHQNQQHQVTSNEMPAVSNPTSVHCVTSKIPTTTTSMTPSSIPSVPVAIVSPTTTASSKAVNLQHDASHVKLSVTSSPNSDATPVDQPVDPVAEDELNEDSAINSSDVYRCSHCIKTYQYRQNLTKHIRNVHGLSTGGTITCLEDGCTFSCRYIQQLRDHLKNGHSLLFTYEKKTFTSMQDFNQWKEELENVSTSNFVKSTGDKKKKKKPCHITNVIELDFLSR
jgi:hypothetical protein